MSYQEREESQTNKEINEEYMNVEVSNSRPLTLIISILETELLMSQQEKLGYV